MKGVETGWSVERYVCPSCKRKGLYYAGNYGGSTPWFCMYRNCKNRHPDLQDVIDANPILLTENPKWKHFKKVSQKDL